MLRKILTIAFVAALLFSFGCKKKESSPVKSSVSDIQKQVEDTGKEAEQQIPEDLPK
jgi:hypothetical protein